MIPIAKHLTLFATSFLLSAGISNFTSISEVQNSVERLKSQAVGDATVECFDFTRTTRPCQVDLPDCNKENLNKEFVEQEVYSVLGIIPEGYYKNDTPMWETVKYASTQDCKGKAKKYRCETFLIIFYDMVEIDSDCEKEIKFFYTNYEGEKRCSTGK